MSEAIQDTEASAPSPAPAPDKRAQVEKVLTEILRLMNFPARLEFQDAADRGIAVAVHFEGEVPPSPPGKRNYLVDSIQFLVNKIVNRPNTERRWVSLGVGGFPEPRGAPGSSPASVPVSAPKVPRTNGAPKAPPSLAPPRAAKVEPREHMLEVTADPVLEALSKALAEKSARLGRSYAVMLLSLDDRARLFKAATGTQGVSIKLEGEDYLRRIHFIPEKPSAMPKKQVMPDYPDDED